MKYDSSDVNGTVQNIIFHYRNSDLHVAKCLINSIEGISDVEVWDGFYIQRKKELVKKKIEINEIDFIQMEEVPDFVFEEVVIEEKIRKVVVNYKFNGGFDYVSIEN